MNIFKRCIKTISEKQVKIFNIILGTTLLALELFLLVFTCILLSKEKSSQVFIYIIITSLFSILTSISTIIFTCLPSNFNKKKKILTIFILLSTATLASTQLYLGIIVQSLENSLQSELKKCDESEVFADVYWSYKRIYSECVEFEGCICVQDSECSVDLVRTFYDLFECDGICGLGTGNCDEKLSIAISEKSNIFSWTLIGLFITLIISGLLVCWLIKLQISIAAPLQVPDRTISNLEGITVHLDSQQLKNPQFFDSQPAKNPEFPDISSIPPVSFLSLDDSFNP